MAGDFFEEFEFRIAHRAIGAGDVEKPVQYVLQQAGARAVLPADLLCVGIKS